MMVWKGCGKKWWWPTFKVLSQNLPGGTEEDHEKVVALCDGPVKVSQSAQPDSLFVM
jgi:hypothetical protein